MNGLRNSFFTIALCGIALCGAVPSSVMAQQVSKEQMKGLDEQIQDIKKDVLSISTELMQLEEKLLYPSNTEVSIFVSLEAGSTIRLDAIDVKVDGKDVTHHIYTFKELDALKSGGVQRIYTGNVRSGEHTLGITVIGKTSGNSNYRQAASYKFRKAVKPKLVEVVVGGPGAAGQPLQFRE